MSDLELSWAAGFFDGEGSTGSYSYRYQRRPRLQINVSQNHRAVLDRFHDAVGVGSVTGPHKQNSGNPRWQFQAYNDTAELVLRRLWRYLGYEKRRQATRAMHLWYEAEPWSEDSGGSED